jgi:hypothetical protein
MEVNAGENEEPLSLQEAAAKAVILAECEKLANAGVTFVAVHFDGYGDDGTTEEAKCYDGEWHASDEHEPVKYDASDLQEHFEALVPFGYENDCGGFGTFRSTTGLMSRRLSFPIWLLQIRPQRWMYGQALETKESTMKEEV